MFESSRGVVAALGVMLVAGCAPNALVALPSERAQWMDDYAAAATSADVTVEARTDDFAGAPLDLGGRATPVHVRLRNGGRAPLRVARESFELVGGYGQRFRTIAPERIAEGRADLGRRALAASTLAPGEAVAGFLYFEPVRGAWPFLHLRAALIDDVRAQRIGTVDVPFGTGRQTSPGG